MKKNRHSHALANEICLQEDPEVSLASLPVTVNDVRFPMYLVAAAGFLHGNMDMGQQPTLYSLYCDWTTIIIDHHVLGCPIANQSNIP